MLHELTGDLPGFRSAHFAEGVNVVVARQDRKPAVEGGRNPVGKTSFVRLLDFLLGSDVRTGNPLLRAELADTRFELDLDLGGRTATVGRGAESLMQATVDDTAMKLPRFRTHLGKELFGLTGEGNEPSYRSVVAYYVRDVTVGGFSSPTVTSLT